VRSSEHLTANRLPARSDAMDAVLQAGAGRDLVGFYAAGGIYAGFANAFGQRNWFASYNFNCDWSFYYQSDKAVKTAYAGFAWEPTAFADKVEAAVAQLDMLHRPPRTVPPGHYRVYLAPAAMDEILNTISWGGFGLKDHRTKQTTLLKMVEEGAHLHPALTIRENTRDGVAPNFQGAGFIKPPQVPLIEAGVYRDCLVSPRSAKEYDIPTNGASPSESPESIEMAAGALPRQDILQRLGTGVYIRHLLG
jgi:predicted Zn-dependent protease